jgi:U4/U6.U5 tri-snRNP-associated protein 2
MSKRARDEEAVTGTAANGAAPPSAAQATQNGGQEVDDDLDLPLSKARRTAFEELDLDLSRNCPFLDTVNRHLLDFDFEKVCSVSLSNLNVYACLICGKYFQGMLLWLHAHRRHCLVSSPRGLTPFHLCCQGEGRIPTRTCTVSMKTIMCL